MNNNSPLVLLEFIESTRPDGFIDKCKDLPAKTKALDCQGDSSSESSKSGRCE